MPLLVEASVDPRVKPEDDGGWGKLCGQYSNVLRNAGVTALLLDALPRPPPVSMPFCVGIALSASALS
ncbi:hypothetical protein B5P46_09005 [Rhizobium leguminosarum]|uniref:Uncharacterized protein n=1 Tax=Rhizobium leguminosarum TaxID=384 RepID=A0A4Q1UCP2_RHILE|nr:hypothetical protein B5P46_09005 [Rhizobium leguminosarum]